MDALITISTFICRELVEFGIYLEVNWILTSEGLPWKQDAGIHERCPVLVSDDDGMSLRC